MTQVWLTLVAWLCAYIAVHERRPTAKGIYIFGMVFFVLLSFALFFYNGGTTG